MTDSELLPIEEQLRIEGPPNDDVVVVRGGPITAEKFTEHAQREKTVYSYRGMPLASVSVDATVAG